MNLGLIGTNLVGRSRLTKTAVKSNRRFLMFCQQITLMYLNLRAFTDHRHDLMINQVNITGDRSNCYSDDTNTVGLHISIAIIIATESLTINLTNCLFSNLDHTALTIISQCYGNNKIYIKNCTFENNYIYRTSSHEDIDFIFRPLINIISAHDNKSISFKQCNITGNYHANILISISIRENKLCHGSRVLCISPITNISFVACQSIGNVASELININAEHCKGNIWIIGPTHFNKTKSGYHRHSHYITISIYYMMVDIIGSVIFSFNHAHTVMFFQNCDIKFYKNITYASNSCKGGVIFLKCSYIKILEYSNVTLLKNQFGHKLIQVQVDGNLNPSCPFQFIALRKSKIVPLTHYSVNIIDNYYVVRRWIINLPKEMCLFSLYDLTPLCKWIPIAAFHDNSPKEIYQQVLKISNQISYNMPLHAK